MAVQTAQKPLRRRLFLLLLLLVSAALTYVTLIAPQLTPLSAHTYQAGQVALEDLQAPRTMTYQSDVLTEQQRQAAGLAVAPVYTPPDTNVARQQLERLRAALAFIDSVRADSHSPIEAKLNDLATLEDIRLSQETAAQILALSDQRWQAVEQEAIVVLEQVMRTTIREDHVDDARRSLPSLVSLSLPEDQATIVAELAAGFIAPNSTYSATQTDLARQKAREAVPPVMRSFIAGETVVQRGQVITPADLEAMQKLGLVPQQETWKSLLSAAALVLLAVAFLVFYLRRNPRLMQDVRSLTVAAILFVVFLVFARLVVNEQPVVAYIFPLAAYSLTIAALFGPFPALITSLPLVFLVSFGSPDAFALMLYYLLGSFFGVITLGRAQRTTAFIWAGAAIAGCGVFVVIAYQLPDPNSNIFLIATLSGASLLNGIASASLALLLQFFLAQFLGMTTALQLMEISRPDHPLMQILLRNAPGTYQHSLQVANLAEQAAEHIGADPLLTRVGALYHDVGKAVNPMFFIENQMPGSQNPHEELTPEESAQIIIRHIPDGVLLARKYRLPGRIADFIREHHGTLLARYQYVNAVKAAGGDESKVDTALFTYPGPTPQSRETAILMLADGSEARMRAENPKNEAEMRELIKSVVQNRINSGQFDATDLTLRELDSIVDTLTAALRGIYHPRIEYPNLEKAPIPRLDPNPTVPSAPRPVSPETPGPHQPDSSVPSSGDPQ
jgi:cyclic-di-AMP phosphodiesterase PgpH